MMADNYYKTNDMSILEKSINEELKRFRAINKYAKNLIYEQEAPNKPEEDPTKPPAGGIGAPPPTGDAGAPPAGDIGAPPTDMGMDAGAPPPDMGGGGAGAPPPDMSAGTPPPETGEDTGSEPDLDSDPTADDTTEEVDVTDLVNMTKSIKKQLEDKENENINVTQKMDTIFQKLTDLEGKLGEMDSVLAKIDQLGSEIEEIRPKTPVEKLEMRSLDSYPFNQKPSDFFNQKQQEMRTAGKNEYVLTKNDVENYGRDQIMKSFQPDEEDDNDNDQEFFKY